MCDKNMLKKILNKIQKLESQKQIRLNKILEIKSDIDDIDSKLKKLYTFKKEYEKLESNSTEYLNSLKWGDVWPRKNKKF